MRPKLYLRSAVCFLIAGMIFLILGFKVPNSHRSLSFVAGGLFMLSSALHFIAYFKNRPA